MDENSMDKSLNSEEVGYLKENLAECRSKESNLQQQIKSLQSQHLKVVQERRDLERKIKSMTDRGPFKGRGMSDMLEEASSTVSPEDGRRYDRSDSERFRRLFIGGLNYDTNDDSLRSHFEQWGDIEDCVVMRDPNSKRSRGFGFITFKESYQVDDVMAARPHVVDKREVLPKRAVPRDESNKWETHMSIKKIFVGRLKPEHDEDQLKDYFEEFGLIDSVEIMMDKLTQKRRGFAFVTFNDYDPVDKIVLLKHHNVGGHNVEVMKAIPKEKMAEMKGGRQPSFGMDDNERSGGMEPRNDNFNRNDGGGYRADNYDQGKMNNFGPGGFGNRDGRNDGQDTNGGGFSQDGGGVGQGHWNDRYGPRNDDNFCGNQQMGADYVDEFSGGGAMRSGNFGDRRPRPYGNGGRFSSGQSGRGQAGRRWTGKDDWN